MRNPGIKLKTGLLGILIAIFLLSLILNGCTGKKQYKLNTPDKKPAPSSQSEYVFPGEFEKQQAIWMMWPSETYDSGNRPVSPVIINIIKALNQFIKVNVLVGSSEEIDKIHELLQAKGSSADKVTFYTISHKSIWTRDVGPLFVKDRQNKLHIVNFGFNNYSRGGNPDYVYTEGEVDKQTAQLLGVPVIDSKLVCEGGAIESNGNGTLMVTESVVLRRNPQLSKKQIEDEFKRVLGIQKVIWLKKGLAEDDRITTGHINEFARFASPDMVLLGQILEEDRYANAISAESYLRLEENYKILQNATDQSGEKLRIIRIPMPPTLYAESNTTGELPLRSYLNYALTNKAVIFQTYWREGRSEVLKKTEEEVKKSFSQIFPGRTIVGIDAENVNLWGGGIHCITQHMPAE